MERKICRWDHSDDYKYTDDHDVRDWGWEFIRRNPLYIKNWKRNLNVFQNYNDAREGLMDAFCSLLLPMLFLEQKGIDECISLMENVKALKKKLAICEKLGINITNPQQYETFEIIGGHWTEWGLHTCQDPDAKTLTACNRSTSLHMFPCVSSAYNRTEKAAPLEKGWCEVRINLAHPILPQIENIKPLIELHQKGYKRYIKSKNPEHEIIDTPRRTKPYKKDLWKNYIRCLDADKMKIKRNIAANKIFPTEKPTPEKKWDETLKQARTMVDSGYRPLMF